MTTYHIRRELHIRKDLGIYIAFGIAAYCKKRMVFHLTDVFLKKQQAVAFTALCNREQPDWRHLYDILEDVM